MKHIFIVNPAAGKSDRTEQIKREVSALFKSGAYEILVSQGPGDCTQLAAQAAETGAPMKIYACGGDGTMNEVVNGAAGYDNVAVTHYPAGSGNDFIKIFSDPGAFRSLERLQNCEEVEFDLIECHADGKKFFASNIASIGFDARIGTEMGKYRRLPFVTGNGAYYLSTIVNLLKGISRKYEITVNDTVISGKQTLACVCNGRWYGGSFNPMPDAEPDDGLLDVLIIKGVSALKVASVIGRYKKGEYAQLPDLVRHLKANSIHIRCHEKNVINLDGEAAYGTDIHFRVSDKKLRFFYPKGLTYRAQQPVGAL